MLEVPLSRRCCRASRSLRSEFGNVSALCPKDTEIKTKHITGHCWHCLSGKPLHEHKIRKHPQYLRAAKWSLSAIFTAFGTRCYKMSIISAPVLKNVSRQFIHCPRNSESSRAGIDWTWSRGLDLIGWQSAARWRPWWKPWLRTWIRPFCRLFFLWEMR